MRGAPRTDKLGRTVVSIEGRYELWDRDIEAVWYFILSCSYDITGEFRQPDQWLVDHVRKIHPENHDGSIEKAHRKLVDEPNEKLDNAIAKDSDNAIADGVRWAAYAHTPKSGAYIRNRSDRLFSGGFGGIQGLVTARPCIHKPNGGYF